MLVHPLLQGAERLCAAAEEDGAESLEIVSEVAEPSHRIGRKARVLALRRDGFERANAAHEILVRQRLVAEVVADQGQRRADVQLEPAVAAEELAARERGGAARAIVRLDELEAGGAEHLGQLRHAAFEQRCRVTFL